MTDCDDSSGVPEGVIGFMLAGVVIVIVNTLFFPILVYETFKNRGKTRKYIFDSANFKPRRAHVR